MSAKDSNGTPAGDDANPEPVTAGESIRVEMEYTVNPKSDFKSQVLIWANADIYNSNQPGPGAYQSVDCGINGGFSNFTRSPAVGDRIDNWNCAADGYKFSDPVIKPNNCPSFYTHSNSNYGPNVFPNGAVYPIAFGDPKPSTNLDHVSTCGFLGASVMWHGNMRNATNPPTTYRYGFNFTAHPLWNEGKICFRGNLSVGAGVAKAIITNLYARSAQRLCFEVKKTTISGLVTSSDQTATGKALGGVPITYSKTCNPATHIATATTGANGLYYFETAQGQTFCILPPVPISVDGTSYNSVSPSSRTGVCNSASCNGYDFVYTPAPVAPNISKSASPPGAALKPGDQIDFTIVVDNPYDSNIQNVNIRDYIPLNVISDLGDPLTRFPRITSFQLVDLAVPGRPAGWKTNYGPNNASLCPFSNAFPIPIVYGDGFPTLTSDVRCGYQHDLVNQPNIFLTFSRMPAYSRLVLNWRGWVKPAAQVGVYPANYTNCNGGVNPAVPGYHAECIDKVNGLQGVSNVALASAQNVLASNFSNLTYNPIPGDITCIGKWDSKAEPDSSGSGPITCPGAGAPANTYVYSPDPTESDFNNGTINLQLNFDNSQGPVEYYVRDQHPSFNGGQLANPIDDPTLFNPDLPTRSYAGRVVSWNRYDGYRWPNNTTANYNFSFNFRDGGLATGGSFTNTAQVCVIKYWEPRDGVNDYDCDTSNTITYKRVDVNRPFLTTRQGSVQGGGGVGACTPASDQFIKNNPGGKGWYVVSSTGAISGLPSLAGQSFTNTTVCRPDLEDAAIKYMDRMPPGNHRINLPPSIPNPQSGLKGKVARANNGNPGNYTINGTTTITDRWTLYVNGDLFINGNIEYETPGGVLDESASLGVIANRIFIAPHVTRVDGYYYAKNGINTCAVADAGYPGGIKSLGFVTPNTQPSDPGHSFPGFSATECGQQLTVNGLLMANKFRYNRIVPPSSGHSEIAAFSDRLFLATPPAFNDLALQLNSVYGGERRPRY